MRRYLRTVYGSRVVLRPDDELRMRVIGGGWVPVANPGPGAVLRLILAGGGHIEGVLEVSDVS